MQDLVKEFNDYRTRMNDVILGKDNLVIKRLWNLDTNTYAAGALDEKTKEMLGLVASMVLRCDDCIKYHLGKCHELDITTEEVYEVFAVANIVGGTIVIPHTRRAAEYWEVLRANLKLPMPEKSVECRNARDIISGGSCQANLPTMSV